MPKNSINPSFLKILQFIASIIDKNILFKNFRVTKISVLLYYLSYFGRKIYVLYYKVVDSSANLYKGKVYILFF